LLLVVGYCAGHNTINFDLGPLPLTLDRILLGGLLTAFVIQWRLLRREAARGGRGRGVLGARCGGAEGQAESGERSEKEAQSHHGEG
jgi:hypothetical protein